MTAPRIDSHQHFWKYTDEVLYNHTLNNRNFHGLKMKN